MFYVKINITKQFLKVLLKLYQNLFFTFVPQNTEFRNGSAVK